MPLHGYILQPTYRIEAGRPVVHLYGKLEDGRTFLLRDGRMRPHFFVRAADRQRAQALGAAPLSPTGKVNMAGEPVLRVEVPLPQDTPPLRDRLIAAGLPCYEADIRFALRYLIDRGIRSALAITPTSPPRQAAGVDVAFDDPEVAPSDFRPRLAVLSLDIETDPRARHVLSIALHGCGAKDVLLLCPRPAACPPGAVPCATEADLLREFARRVRALDPDVLTGWNVIDFDLHVLLRIAQQLDVPLDLGRGPGGLRVDLAQASYSLSRAHLPGRVVIDGIQGLRAAFVRMEDYSLDAVAREVLGEGKAISPAGKGRPEEILRLYKNDPAAFCHYNLTDARLALDILEKLRLFDLTVARSLLTGMPPDRVSASIASFDLLYLSELSRRGVVGPTLADGDGEAEPTAGGHVLDPEPGLYRHVVTLDFKSLYPSLIRTFQIDPLGHVPHPQPGEDVIVAPNGAAFRREPGILTQLLDQLFPSREAAKREGDAVRSHAIKILMNSFYGVLGTSACRFHSPELANAITSLGKMVLLWSKQQVEDRGYRVIYGDTDSLFVLTGADHPDAARAAGQALVTELNAALSTWLREEYRVESKLELEFDTLYLRLLLPHVRGGGAGARKRYAGLIEDEKGRRQVEFTGLEVVRRDWTGLAKQVQRTLYERLFSDQPVDAYLRQVVRALRAGHYDGELVYRKALRKDLAAYTASTPPHVAAARKMAAPPGRLIAYVMTTGGPEPADERKSPIDHEHYVQRQVRPVAEPVLQLLHLDFDRVVGDNTQLELF